MATMADVTVHDWNKVAQDHGLTAPLASRIFMANSNYSNEPGSKYHGVNSNLRAYGDIFQRCYDPQTKRLGNRSSQDMLKISYAQEEEWEPTLKWNTRHSSTQPVPICFLCGKPILDSSDIQSEHILPFSTAVCAGVINNPKNYAPAHSLCNNKKDNKLSMEQVDTTLPESGDFNDLAKGYQSLLRHMEGLSESPVVVNTNERETFVMMRIICSLADYENAEPDEKELIGRRIEIMEKLAKWFMDQKVIKSAVASGDVGAISRLVSDSETEVTAKYAALKWKGTVALSELNRLKEEKEENVRQLTEANKKTARFSSLVAYCFARCMPKKGGCTKTAAPSD